MKITLPVGYLTEDGRRLREAEVGMMDGHALKALRQALGQNRRLKDVRHYLVALRAGLKDIEGLGQAITESIIKNLFWPDAEYILHVMALLELEASGEPARLRRTCPSCGQDVTIEVDLAGRELRPIEDTGYDPDTITLPFKLSQPLTTLDQEGTPYDSGYLTLHTVDDFIAISKRVLNNMGAATFFSLARAIKELGPKGKGEIDEVELELLPAVDIKRLEKLYNENEPGLEELGTGECPVCGAEVPLDPVDYIADFLLVSL